MREKILWILLFVLGCVCGYSQTAVYDTSYIYTYDTVRVFNNDTTVQITEWYTNDAVVLESSIFEHNPSTSGRQKHINDTNGDDDQPSNTFIGSGPLSEERTYGYIDNRGTGFPIFDGMNIQNIEGFEQSYVITQNYLEEGGNPYEVLPEYGFTKSFIESDIEYDSFAVFFEYGVLPTNNDGEYDYSFNLNLSVNGMVMDTLLFEKHAPNTDFDEVAFNIPEWYNNDVDTFMDNKMYGPTFRNINNFSMPLIGRGDNVIPIDSFDGTFDLNFIQTGSGATTISKFYIVGYDIKQDTGIHVSISFEDVINVDTTMIIDTTYITYEEPTVVGCYNMLGESIDCNTSNVTRIVVYSDGTTKQERIIQ